MTKYLDTSTLTKYTSGNNKGHFYWKENIGKANLFMDWVWDVIEAYRHNELTPQINITPLTDAITTLTQSMTQM